MSLLGSVVRQRLTNRAVRIDVDRILFRKETLLLGTDRELSPP